MSNVKDYYATPEAIENEGSDKYTCQIRISESRGEGLSGDTVDLYWIYDYNNYWEAIKLRNYCYYDNKGIDT